MTTVPLISPLDLDLNIRSGVAAQMLGVSSATINRLVHQGALTVLRRTPGGHFRLSYREVVALRDSLLGPDPHKAKATHPTHGRGKSSRAKKETEVNV